MQKDLALFHQAAYLTGPTGVGKSEISLALAEQLDAEIIALDAMTLYKGMDIGTAKPSAEDQRRVPHHLIDTVSPQATSDLEQYLAAAQTVLQNIAGRGKRALFVGGSPLYLKAALRGLSELPHRDDAVRARLESEAASSGVPALHARLAVVDAESAGKIAATDLRRVVRSLEIYEVSGGVPPSQLRGRHDEPAPPSMPVFALLRDRPVLYDRINRRVDAMFACGLVEEVGRLPQPLSHTAQQAVGYAEVLAMLAGQISREEAMERTKLRTRHYAKHQLTWFRNLQEVRGFSVEGVPAEEAVGELARRIEMVRQGLVVPGEPIQTMPG
ncbi:MAG: tRNA (adenosine(37)-N6)-dimethylallyltransferase MiaA [Isosphaeraceae bacterium]